MSGIARVVRRDDGAGKSRPRRPASDRRDAGKTSRLAVRTVSDPERASGPARADAVRRRAADARDRTRADDAAEDPDSRRADAGTCAGDPGDAVESARAP